ncbi:MAG: hypothetical protein V2I33_21420 [Kangiellaceae bacterium]|nr:hypothetical protein [Kangiellaceae bacterium]
MSAAVAIVVVAAAVIAAAAAPAVGVVVGDLEGFGDLCGASSSLRAAAPSACWQSWLAAPFSCRSTDCQAEG